MKLEPKEEAAVLHGKSLAYSLRVQNSRYSILLFIGTGLRFSLPWLQLIAGALLILFTYGAVTVWNDISDLKIDQSNHRDLPLAQARISLRQAKYLSAACCMGCIGLATLLYPSGFLYLFTTLGLGVAYSVPPLAVEKRGLLATFLLSICYTLLPIALAVFYRHQVAIDPFLIVAGILLSMTSLLYKDYKDEAGDKLFGKITPLIKYGTGRMNDLAVILFTVGTLLLIYSSQIGWWLVGNLVSAISLYAVRRRLPQVSAILIGLYNLGVAFSLVLLIKT